MTTIVGIILLIIGGVLAAVIFSSGGTILPHIAGPILFAAIGTALIALKRIKK